MTDTPTTPSILDSPQVPEAKKGPLGIEPWMIAFALGLGFGAVAGIKITSIMKPPRLPARTPGPEYAQRMKAEPGDPMPAPRPAPPVIVPEEIKREFSAQAIPDVPPPADPAGPVPSVPADPFDAEELPDG